LTPEWLIWYGLHLGLNYTQAHDIVVGELLDLITIDQIKKGELSLRVDDDYEIIPDVR
jgi:hypothetical protein